MDNKDSAPYSVYSVSRIRSADPDDRETRIADEHANGMGASGSERWRSPRCGPSLHGNDCSTTVRFGHGSQLALLEWSTVAPEGGGVETGLLSMNLTETVVLRLVPDGDNAMRVDVVGDSKENARIRTTRTAAQVLYHDLREALSTAKMDYLQIPLPRSATASARRDRDAEPIPNTANGPRSGANAATMDGVTRKSVLSGVVAGTITVVVLVLSLLLTDTVGVLDRPTHGTPAGRVGDDVSRQGTRGGGTAGQQQDKWNPETVGDP